MSERDNSWIVKGAKVFLLNGHVGNATLSVRPAYVEKVNKKTFTLHGDDAKVSLTTLREQTASAWTQGFEVVHPDDPRVAEVRQRIRVGKAEMTLESAFTAWKRSDHGRGELEALRDAITAVENEYVAYAEIAPQRITS